MIELPEAIIPAQQINESIVKELYPGRRVPAYRKRDIPQAPDSSGQSRGTMNIKELCIDKDWQFTYNNAGTWFPAFFVLFIGAPDPNPGSTYCYA